MRGEELISLGTRKYREAERRAELLNAKFKETLKRAVSEADKDGAALAPILQQYFKDPLKEDLDKRLERPSGYSVYAYWWEPGDPGTPVEADLKAIREARNSFSEALAQNRLGDPEEFAESLLAGHSLPKDLPRRLAAGFIEARIEVMRWTAPSGIVCQTRSC